jgi:hypothetical protein
LSCLEACGVFNSIETLRSAVNPPNGASERTYDRTLPQARGRRRVTSDRASKGVRCKWTWDGFRKLHCRAGEPARQTPQCSLHLHVSNCNSYTPPSDSAQQPESTQNRPPVHLPHLVPPYSKPLLQAVSNSLEMVVNPPIGGTEKRDPTREGLLRGAGEYRRTSVRRCGILKLHCQTGGPARQTSRCALHLHLSNRISVNRFS